MGARAQQQREAKATRIKSKRHASRRVAEEIRLFVALARESSTDFSSGAASFATALVLLRQIDDSQVV